MLCGLEHAFCGLIIVSATPKADFEFPFLLNWARLASRDVDSLVHAPVARNAIIRFRFGAAPLALIFVSLLRLTCLAGKESLRAKTRSAFPLRTAGHQRYKARTHVSSAVAALAAYLPLDLRLVVSQAKKQSVADRQAELRRISDSYWYHGTRLLFNRRERLHPAANLWRRTQKNDFNVCRYD